MKKFFYTTILTLVLITFVPAALHAATMSVSPNTGVYTAGATFTVRVSVNTTGKSVNAAEGTVKFNPSELSVVSVDRSSSIFNLWVTEPTFSNTAGTVTFSGGLPSGYTGSSGTVFSITFRAKAAGSPKVSLTGGSVLANDGMGTNVLTAMNGGSYTIQAESTTPEAEVVVEYVAPANTPAMPIIKSETHQSDGWSNNKNAVLKWSVPADVEAVRTLLDSSASSIPTKVYDNPISEIELTDLDEGISYFHIQFKNADGWGKVAHYRLAVDTEKPEVFNIAPQEGTDLTSPELVLKLDVKDAASGVEKYMVRIDTNEPYEYLDKDAAGTIKLAQLEPGYHTVVIEAFDRAGNSLVSTYSFTIESFAKPQFTEFPAEINEDVIPVIKGETRPEATVVVMLQKIGAEATEYTVTADKNGVFTFIPDGRFTTGVYELSAKATDKYGARSEASETIKIAVQEPGFVRIGGFIVSILSVLMPLLALLVLLAVFSWYVILYLRRFKKKLTVESAEVVAVLDTEFADILSNLTQKREEVAASRKTKKLTKTEEATFGDLEQLISDAKAKITKEVLDIEKLLHHDRK